MKILFLSRWFPWPADNGARTRIYHLIRTLASRHEVHLISFTEGPIEPTQFDEMRRWCASVEAVPYRPFRPDRARALVGYFDPRPRSVLDTFSPELAAAVDRSGACDVALASEIDMAPYALKARARWRVLEELEVGVISGAIERAQRPAAAYRARLTWWKLSRYVRDLLRRFDACSVVSEAERERVSRLAPAGKPVVVIPNGVDIDAAKAVSAEPKPESLVYAGALTFSANYDAVAYFLADIYPQLIGKHPGLTFTVTGRTDGVDLARLPAHPGVRFSGYLADVRPAVAGAWLTVVPLRIGGGTRLKILESLALGTPIVSTSKGAEGLDLVDGRDVLLADTPDAFARAVERMLTEPGLRAELSDAGRLAAKRYDWTMMGGRLLALLSQYEAAGST